MEVGDDLVELPGHETENSVLEMRNAKIIVSIYTVLEA
jgi:hypothetical protein